MNNLYDVTVDLESITHLSMVVHQVAVEKGWYVELSQPNFPEKLALVHSELSETLEEYRNGASFQEIYYNPPESKPEGIAVELADAMIRILDMCAQWEIPIAEAMRQKMAYNMSRPHRHGGKRA